MLKEWLDFIAALAWPSVALIAFIYLVKSDFITKNIGQIVRVSKAVDEFKPMVAELVAAEEKLRQSGESLSGLSGNLDTLSEKLSSMDATLGLIFDKVDQRQAEAEAKAPDLPKPDLGSEDRERMYNDMQAKFGEVIGSLESRFGWFDKRAVGSTAYRFTHGNRKDALDMEIADEISRLHSSWKSYLRRSQDLDLWLDTATYQEFVSTAERVIAKVNEGKLA